MRQQKKDIEQRLAGLSPEKRKLFEELLKRETRGDAPASPTIEHRSGDGPSPLSFGQQRLWFIDRLEPESLAYNLPLLKRFSGPLDAAALQRAIGEIVVRHEVLRTKYVTVDGVPLQEPCAAEPFDLPVEDLSELAPQARAAQARRLVAATVGERFDLASGPTIRGRLLKYADDDHVLVLGVHHIVYDLWSGGVFWHELDALLAAFTAGQASPLPPLPIQYRDFARWQRETMTDEALAPHLAYWRAQLDGVPFLIALPADRPRPSFLTGRAGMELLSIPADTAAKLRAIARAEQATMFMLLAAAFQTVLHWYSGADDVVIGSPIANRKPAETEPLIGIFLNNLVLRGNLSGDPTFTELLARSRRTVLDAFAHTDVPFERLVEELQPRRALNVHPLFQVLFTLLSSTRRQTAMTGAVPADGLDSVSVAMDLEAYFDDTGESIGALFKYSSELFEHATIVRLCDQFRRLVAAVAENPQRRLAELRSIAQEGERALREGWNDTRLAVPEPRLVHRMVEAQVAACPSADAVIFDGGATSYRELDAQAERVASHLRAAGVGPGDRVGIYMQRSTQLVAALLGVLKSGAAYLPIDPAFPRDRIAFMLADSEAAAVMTDAESRPSLPDTPARIFVAADLDSEAPASNVRREATPEDAAYVIYTSGSTGRPKGVVVPHRAVANFLASMRVAPGLTADDRLLAITTLSFDIAGLELFLPLTTGATVILASREDAIDPRRLTALLDSSRATVMQATPATWRMLLDAGWKGRRELTALCGGEALPEELARPLAQRVRALWNMYGPTETTIWSTIARVEANEPITIGRPIANTRVEILDPALRPVPIGAVGEICIGGDGVALGYWRRPELTAERFIAEGGGRPGTRLYRTGDLGRYRSDGRLECLGRIDHQVKVRGFRIELGEIESVLAGHPDVSQAVAHVREDVPGDPRIVAYVVAAADAANLTDALKAKVADALPQYMHPSAYVRLDAFPLTPNGKIDRRALPAPDAQSAPRSSRPPRSALEREIADVWTDLLKAPSVGIDDNFFDLGGHSLLLVQVQSRLAARGHEIAVLDLFQHPTVAALARHLAGDAIASTFTEAARARARQSGADDAIAVVGLAGRFPGSADVEQFWTNLKNGVEGIRFFTDEELKAAGVADRMLQDPAFVKARGSLDGADLFDAPLFGFTPREADLMDPQHRVFLECAWEALDRAGYDPQAYAGAIAVFAGSSLSGYTMQALAQGSYGIGAGDLDLLLNGDKDHLPTRVSYKLNLRGPAVTVQTACSTSLVAVHMACQSLLRNECDMALAGGVSIGMAQVGGYQYVQGSIGSPDGHCRPFDASAGGTVGGNGVGIVVLKRLADAMRDGDHVHAVVRATAINNDGSAKIGYTAPGIDGQSRVIAAAQAASGIDAGTIGYVEAHGTGTALGDPIEVKALTQVFRESTRAARYCAIGSVKSNIGHLDAAAGVAGFIKAALAVEHGEIPPSLHFEKPNPEIDFESSPFFVNTALRRWESDAGTPRRAAVSSFGLGGTNAHAILEEAPPIEPSGPSRDWQILAVSGRTPTAVDAAAERLAQHLESNVDLPLADVAFTLAVGRQNLECRRAVVCRDAAEAVRALRRQSGTRTIEGRGRRQPRIAFLFPGQGAQSIGMGAGLYAAEDIFRAEFDRCAALFRAELGIDLREAIDAADAPNQAWTTTITQAALFATEYALARLWMSWGVEPAAMAGHSIGEYVAAALSGAVTLEDAVSLVACRARLMDAAPAGAMLAVSLDHERARAYTSDEVSLAADNAPAQCVLSGSPDRIARAAAQLTTDGVDFRRLQTAGAFHSALMDGVVAPLTEAARAVGRGPIAIPYVSNVTGTWITDADLADASYWSRHVRSAVQFRRGVQALLESGIDLLVEVGPGQTLTGLARQIAAGGEPAAAFVTSLPRQESARDERESIARALAHVWAAGLRPAWDRYFANERRRRVVLPAYPFERRRHWLEPVAAGATVAARPRARVKDPDIANWFFTPEWQSIPSARLDPGAITAAGPWLVLGEATGASAALVNELRASGADVTVLTPAEGSAANVTAALTRLRDEQRLPRAVVHAWAAAEGATVDRAFNGLMLLARAAGQIGVQVPSLVVTLTAGVHNVVGTEPIACDAATALGPSLVFPVEHEGTRSSAIDLVASEWTASTVEHTRALMAAMLDPNNPSVTAIRNGRRWSRSFHQQALAATAAQHVEFRPGGVFLITGGYGGVGLELARVFAERSAGARLVLTGRSGLPDRASWPALAQDGDARVTQRIAAVESLETLGAEVVTFAADVTDAGAMRRVAEDIAARFGKLDAVVHAAGLPGARVMQLDDGEESGRVLAPKVQGTKVLFQALEHARVQPELVVLCSSINTTGGAVGQAAYTAANAYLDAVAQAAPAARRVLTINWDAWQEVGMAVNTSVPERLARLRREELKNAILSAEGRDAFVRLLGAAPGPQVIVSTRDIRPIAAAAPASAPAAAPASMPVAGHERPELGRPFVAPRNPIEEEVAEVWRQLFGLAAVGVDDDFFELGGHSLLATQVMSRIRDRFQVDLGIGALFEESTVAGLSMRVMEQMLASDAGALGTPA